jgi:hypothetical protein
MITLCLASFHDLVHTDFSVHDAKGPACCLHLDNIEIRSNTPEHEDFSLVFRGPGDVFLPQGIYLFNHPSIGDFDCFLVPYEEVKDGFLYTAVFNLIK